MLELNALAIFVEAQCPELKPANPPFLHAFFTTVKVVFAGYDCPCVVTQLLTSDFQHLVTIHLPCLLNYLLTGDATHLENHVLTGEFAHTDSDNKFEAIGSLLHTGNPTQLSSSLVPSPVAVGPRDCLPATYLNTETDDISHLSCHSFTGDKLR